MFGLAPNILGKFEDIYGGPSQKADGAFSVSSMEAGVRGSISARYAIFSFDASDSNSIYAGSSVQPKALQALPCIKI